MSGVDRDIQCGNSFARLYELGCFDEEFVIYGCGYREHGQIKYLLSANADRVYRFIDDSVLYDRCYTPVIKKVTHCAVASGMWDEIKRDVMLALALEIKAAYPQSYYDELASRFQRPAQDLALDLLQQERESLEGCFDNDRLMLFEGLCREALAHKVLTRPSYDKLDHWLKHVRRQMENDIIEKNQFRRVFSGFAYEQKGMLCYFSDANKVNVWQKRYDVLAQGELATPILSREYWFGALNALTKVRKDFQSYLQAMINEVYITQVKTIWKLYQKEC